VRQLASRARRRVRGTAPLPDPDLAQQRRLVSAFLKASREGDFDGLVALLDPDVVFRVRGRVHADAVQGAEHVARRVLERGTPLAPLGRPALVNGTAGILVGPLEQPIAVAAFSVAHGRITSVDVIISPTLVG
jgi:RNA polymerase sigma-70 factor (ECF subfamily)